MSHRKALFIFLFVVFRAGFYFSQENDGSFNNIVSLSSPKTFLMSVPLIEKLLPLTFLQAKSFLGSQVCLALTDSPRVVPRVLPAVQLSPGPLPDLPVCSEMQLFSKGEAWLIEQEDPQEHE